MSLTSVLTKAAKWVYSKISSVSSYISYIPYAVIVVLALLYWYETNKFKDLELSDQKQATEYQKAVAKAETDARAKEHKLQQQTTTASDQYEAQHDADQKRIADLNIAVATGAKRLRNELNDAATDKLVSSTTHNSSCTIDSTKNAVLDRSDIQHLVSIAGQGDDYAGKLKALQQIIKSLKSGNSK